MIRHYVAVPNRELDQIPSSLKSLQPLFKALSGGEFRREYADVKRVNGAKWPSHVGVFL